MKTSSSQLFYGAAFAAFLALGFTLAAQEPPAAASKQTPAENRTPTADAPAAPSPAPTAPDAPPAPAADPDAARQPAATTDTRATEPPLRDISQTDQTDQPQPTRRSGRRSSGRVSGGTDFPFGDHSVAGSNRVREVVSIFGSSTVEGEVDSDAVSVFGQTTVGPEARVGGAAVAVLGKLIIDGEVKNEAVSVLGASIINGHVGNEAVCVLGNMELGPKAVIDGDVVVVGGRLTKHPDAIVRGNEVRVPLMGGLVNIDWLTTWVKRCLLMGRPLAFGHNLGWAWAIALSFLAFYVLLALVFPRPIEKCVLTLETRPGSTILASVLTVLLTPVAIVLLAITVVGALLIPFVSAGLIFAGLFGKAVMLAWIGRRVTGDFEGRSVRAGLAVLVGGAIVLLLYVVPIFGFLLFKVLGWLGLGVVVYTILLAMKREKPTPPATGAETPAPDVPIAPVPASFAPMEPAAPASSVGAAPAFAAEPAASSTAPTSEGFVGAPAAPLASDPAVAAVGITAAPAGATAAAAAMSPPTTFGAAMVPPAPPLRAAAAPSMSAPVPATTLPRASLWLRLGALFLDVVLIALIVNLLNHMLPYRIRFDIDPPAFLPWLAIYGAVMWKIKGTTIGGIVCGLKVVRTDGREIDWPTAVVRALGCFLSLFVAGLGFIWIAIDNEKQSWHDKIAGTAVVRVPKGVPLV